MRESLRNPEAPRSWGVSAAARGAPGFGFDPDVLDLNFCAVAGKRAQSRPGGCCHPGSWRPGPGNLNGEAELEGWGASSPLPQCGAAASSPRLPPPPIHPPPAAHVIQGSRGALPLARPARRRGSSGRGVRAPPQWVGQRGAECARAGRRGPHRGA